MAFFRVPDGVGWTNEPDEGGDPRVFVALLPGGPVSVLPDVSALIWVAAVEMDDPVVETVARQTGHPVETVRADVEAFLEDLVGRGLLVRVDDDVREPDHGEVSTRRPC